MSGESPLERRRWEVFAAEMATHGSRALAAEEAGYAGGFKQRGHELMQQPSVLARISYLRAAREERALGGATDEKADALETLKADVLESLKQTRALAFERKDLAAANRSNQLLGQTESLFSDARRVEQPDPIESMSSEELEQTIAGFLRDPLLRAMVERGLDRYRDGDRQRPDDPEPEGGG